MKYIVSYDLRKPEQNYQGLISRIKEYTHCKVTESCWILSVSWSSKKICDDLIRYLDSNDRIIVAKLTGDAAWMNLLSSNDDVKKIL